MPRTMTKTPRERNMCVRRTVIGLMLQLRAENPELGLIAAREQAIRLLTPNERREYLRS